MKLTIDPKALAETVAWAARALPNRPTTPVLAGLLLEVDGDQLTISAFDYDTSAKATITCDTVNEPGRIVLPGRLLAEITKSLPGRSMVEIAATDTEAVITCGSAEFVILALPTDDYPTLPNTPPAAGTIDGAQFAAAVGQIAHAASRDDTLPMLTGIRIDSDDDKLTLAATDRYRIAVRTLPWTPTGQPISALIHGHTLHDIARGLAGQVTLGLADGLAALAAAHRHTTVRLLDEQFIDYMARVTLDGTSTARVDAEQLVDAVKRVSLVAERNTAVHLAFNQEQVRVWAGGGEYGRGGDTVPCELDGPDLEIAFQSQFLIDALAAIDGQAVIGMTGEVKPALFSSEDGTYRNLTMALRVST